MPSHIGIVGNDVADELANRGCYMDDTSNLKITFSDALHELKRKILDDWQQDYTHGSTLIGKAHFLIQDNIQLRPWFHGMNLNGLEIKILTRLRTNHGLCGLKRHLFRLQPTWICEDCKVNDTLEHIIFHCDKHNNVRRDFDFFTRHGDMKSLLKSDVKTLREVVRFYVC